MPNLVSILIPAYNAEKWIADTIKSAQGKSLREIGSILNRYSSVIFR